MHSAKLSKIASFILTYAAGGERENFSNQNEAGNLHKLKLLANQHAIELYTMLPCKHEKVYFISFI